MTQILIKCSGEIKTELKEKAKAEGLTLTAYLVLKGLNKLKEA